MYNKIIRELDRINSLIAETQANSDIGNCNLNEIYNSIEKLQEELKAQNILRLHVSQDYNGGYHCTDDNYDPTPIDYDRAAYNPMGHGLTALNALKDYLMENTERDIDYIISGKDLI